LADIHRRNGDYEQAQKYFEAAVQNAPQMEQARIGLGRVLLEGHDPHAALVHLRQAEQLDPANEVPYFLLARAYQALGNSGEARKALTEFRRLRTEKRKLSFPGMFRENTLTEQKIEPETENAPP
jgi:predicted Zn-dependent protease